MATKAEYDAGHAAAIKVIQEIEAMVPGMFRGMIPRDKEPALADRISHSVIDAAAKARGNG
jgi:hypothetical protein